MPAMQKVFFETGEGGMGYVLANEFGAVMASNQAIECVYSVPDAKVWVPRSEISRNQFNRGSAVTGIRVKRTFIATPLTLRYLASSTA